MWNAIDPMPTSFEPGELPEEGFVPLCVPEIRGNEWQYIKECLDTNFVSSVGPFVDRFEEELARRVGARYAVATVNGTSALHIALLVAGIQPDDQVLLPALTFIAPANAVRYVGAWPVFIDVETQYWQMDTERVRDFLERHCSWRTGALRDRATGRRVRGILPVHVLGHPVDMDPILELARKYDLVVIEDATESLGAKYKGRMVGQLSDIACFSFNGNKIITTGGGGMIVTDNDAWAQKARYLTTQAKDDPLEFVHGDVGYNYRLTNVQAAIGCAQLEKLEEYVAIKRHIAARYREAFKTVAGLTPMAEAPWADSSFWMSVILIDSARYGEDRYQLLHRLHQAKIQARPLWQPLHRSPAHKEAPATACPVAESLNRNALSLPCSVGLRPTEQARVIDALGLGKARC